MRVIQLRLPFRAKLAQNRTQTGDRLQELGNFYHQAFPSMYRVPFALSPLPTKSLMLPKT